MTLSKKSNQLLREFNTLMRIKPLLLNRCEPKHVSYGGCWGESHNTLGVEAEQVRVYKQYGHPKTLAFSSYFIKGVQRIKVSIEDNNGHEGKTRERNHLGVDSLSVDDFHDKLKQVLRILRCNEKDRNLEYAIEQFTSPEYLI